MKKTVFVFAAVLLVAVLSGALVSCGTVWAAIPDADLTFDEMVSDKITQEDWQNILSEAEDVLNYRVKSETEDLGYHSCIISEICGGRKRYVETRTNLEGESKKWKKELFVYEYSDENGNYRITYDGDGKWQKEDWFVPVGNLYHEIIQAVDTYLRMQSGDEYELIWNEEKQGYFCEIDNFYCIFKIKDGKLCALEDYIKGDEEAIETFIFYDFGEVDEIVLPSVD